MDSRHDVYASGIRCWLEVGDESIASMDVPGDEYYSILSAELRFKLNSVPMAVVTVNLGTADTGDSVATKEIVTDWQNCFCQVMFECTGTTYPGGEFMASSPDSKQQWCIFKGRIKTISTAMDPNPRLQLVIMHWLSELNNTHWLSTMFDPGFSDGWILPVGFNSPIMTANATGVPTTLQQQLMALPLDADLWSGTGGLQDFLLDLADLSSKVTGSPSGATDVGKAMARWPDVKITPVPNTNAIYALERINCTTLAPKLNVLTSSELQAIRPNVMAYLAGHLSSELAQPRGNNTLWDKLVVIANDLKLQIIPRVETAILAPLVPALSNEYDLLEAEDIIAVSNCQLSALNNMRGVLLLTNNGVQMTGAQKDKPPLLTACYDSYTEDKNAQASADIPGYFYTELAPPWLTSATGAITPSAVTTGVQANTGNTTSNPKAEVPANTKSALAMLGTNLAKFSFYSHLYNGRNMNIACPLRFDIAPGTTLVVDMSKDEGLSEIPAIRGLVSDVAIDISCNENQAAARTTITLDQLQVFDSTKGEGGIDGVAAIDEHPLYNVAWSGCPLLQDEDEEDIE